MLCLFLQRRLSYKQACEILSFCAIVCKRQEENSFAEIRQILLDRRRREHKEKSGNTEPHKMWISCCITEKLLSSTKIAFVSCEIQQKSSEYVRNKNIQSVLKSNSRLDEPKHAQFVRRVKADRKLICFGS